MPKVIDMTGQRFGRLHVTTRAPNKGTRRDAMWICNCTCGRVVVAAGIDLRRGQSSCRPCSNLKHGNALRGDHSSEYVSWRGMQKRCYHPSTKSYADYGGRGVKVHPAWRDSFEAFLAYMGSKPTKAHQIDRIDPFGDYEPGNVRWATPSENSRNKRIHHVGRAGHHA